MTKCDFSGCPNAATKKVTVTPDCGCTSIPSSQIAVCGTHPARAEQSFPCHDCGNTCRMYLIPNGTL